MVCGTPAPSLIGIKIFDPIVNPAWEAGFTYWDLLLNRRSGDPSIQTSIPFWVYNWTYYLVGGVGYRMEDYKPWCLCLRWNVLRFFSRLGRKLIRWTRTRTLLFTMLLAMAAKSALSSYSRMALRCMLKLDPLILSLFSLSIYLGIPCTHVCIYVSMYLCIYMHIYIFMCICGYVCVCMCLCVYVYVCVYACMYTWN